MAEQGQWVDVVPTAAPLTASIGAQPQWVDVKVEPAGTGVLAPETLDQSLTGAISRGALGGITFGASEAIPKRLGLIPAVDPLGPEAQHPYVSFGSGVAGGLLTGGSLANLGGKSVPALIGAGESTLSNAIKNALLKTGPAGAVYAGVSGAVNKFGEPGSTPEQIVTAGVKQAPLGYGLGILIPGTVGGVNKLFKTIGSVGGRTGQQLFSGAANASIEGADKHLPEILAYAGPRNPNVSPTEQLIEGAWKAVNQRTDITRKYVDNATQAIKSKYFTNYNDQAKALVRAEADKLLTRSPQEKQAIINRIEATIDNTTPEELLNVNKQLNAETAALHDPLANYDNLTKYELNIKKKLAEYNSNIVKNMMNDAGVDPDIYSDSGRIATMASTLSKNLANAAEADTIAAGSSVAETATQRATEKGFGAGTAAGIKQAANKITNGKVGDIDRKTLRIFEKIEPQAAQLRQTTLRPSAPFGAGAPQPVVPPVAPQAPTPPVAPIQPVPAAPGTGNLEAQIAALIRTYPPKLRKDPAMARLAAKAQLGVQ